MATPPSPSEEVLSRNIQWFMDEYPLPVVSPEEWEIKGKEEFKHSRVIGAALLEGLIEQICYTRQEKGILLSLKLRGEDDKMCSVEGNDLDTLSTVIVSQILLRIDPEYLRTTG